MRFTAVLLTVVFCISGQAGERVMVGRVTDSKDRPLKGVRVEWGYFSAAPEEREFTLTDEDGEYELRSSKIGATYRLGFFSKGMAPVWFENVIPGGQDNPDERTVRMLPGDVVRGRLLDDSGEPVVGIKVSLQSASSGFFSSFSSPTPSYPYPGPQRAALSGPDGRFEIDSLPSNGDQQNPLKFAVSVESGSGSVYPRGSLAASGEPIVTIPRSWVSKQPATGEIKAQVIDDVTGEPLESFKYVVRHRASMIPVIHPKGHFAAKGLSTDRLRQILIYAPGHAPFALRVVATRPGEGRRHECRLKRSTDLQGIVVDSDGTPIAGAEVVVGTDNRRHARDEFFWGHFSQYVDGHMSLDFVQRLTTAENGRFQFSETEKRSEIAVMTPGFARSYLPSTERAEDRPDKPVTVSLQQEGILEGTVLLHGKPEAGATVSLSEDGRFHLNYESVKADRHGRFVFRNLPAGRFIVSVMQQSGNTGTLRASRYVHISAGQTTQVTFGELKGPYTVSGTAPPFALINLRPDAPADWTGTGTIADADGRFSLPGLDGGEYHIRVTVPSGLSGYHGDRRSQKIMVSADHTIDLRQRRSF